MAGGGSSDPRIGTFLKDKWRIDARLGRGGVATVYSATHRNGNRVAIKMLNREVARNPDIRGRFLREGYAANAVAHPGVVRVLDDDTTPEGQPFLVMDLLAGELVDDRRMRLGGRLPIREVLRIGDRVLDVLAAAHEKAILHRDIKPENIFMCESGDVRVLDFGIARMREAAAGELTATGMLLGTPEFMSPEQANGIQGDVDALTDIWGLGATLFTLLSGEPVHEAANTTAQILATVSRPARSLSSVTHDIPRPIIDVVDRALAFEKRMRWPSARAMQEALAAAAVQVVDFEPNSDEDETIARELLPASAPASIEEPTNRRPSRGIPIEDETTTVAEERPPVSPMTRTEVDMPLSRRDAVPTSEDMPTRVVIGHPVEEPSTRMSTRPAELAATLVESRPRILRPRSPMMDDDAPPSVHEDDDPIDGPRSKTSVMPSVQSPAALPFAATARMPLHAPASMGGFILRKRTPFGAITPGTPTGPGQGANGRTWTTIAIGVGIGVLVLWVLLVVVLRALFR